MSSKYLLKCTPNFTIEENNIVYQMKNVFVKLRNFLICTSKECMFWFTKYSTDDGNEGAVYRMSLLDIEGTEFSYDQKI